MTNNAHAKATCLCGNVTIDVEKMPSEVGACHCDTCRKWSGGPLLTIDCETHVSFSGEDYIATYSSSEWAERGFCRQCGSHLFYRLNQTGQYFLTAGLFDNVGQLHFDHQIFIEQKPHYYHFANDTKTMTGEEVFALFAKGD